MRNFTMHDVGRLHKAVTGLHQKFTNALVFKAQPALKHVDKLQIA